MVISGRRSRVHKGLLHGTARGPELDDLRAHRIKIDATRASEYSAGRMWIVLLPLLVRFRSCLRGFGLVRA